MFRTILIAALITMLSQNSMAHKCVLTGNNTAEIIIYNSCKNDLASGVGGHSDTKDSERIKELEQEKEQLEDKILALKRYLLDLLKFIE